MWALWMLHIFMSRDSVKNNMGFHFPIKCVTSTPFQSVQLQWLCNTDEVNFYNIFLNTLIMQTHICNKYSFSGTMLYPTPKTFTLPATAHSSVGLPQASSGSADNLSTSAQQRQRYGMTRDAPSRLNNYSHSVESGSDVVSNSPTSDAHLASTEEVDCQLCQGQGSSAAVKYCLVCGLNLCNGCLASHNMFPPNRQHKLWDLV